jgi:hypothetical protein
MQTNLIYLLKKSMKRLISRFKEWVKRHIVDNIPDDDEHEFSDKYRD